MFDIPLLAARLGESTVWARSREDTSPLATGYFGASTGAAAALIAARRSEHRIAAVVSRGGRPDLAGQALHDVEAPTLLLVGSLDLPVVPLNEAAFERLAGIKELTLVPGAGHLFEEAGTLDLVVQLAAAWFERFLPGPTAPLVHSHAVPHTAPGGRPP
ncbi:hypothetical protein OOT46_00965 [Aquabacterium sp. A7-Y]|uniref:dienelactone hydrolase family protein n=1 Tax=Aquabacterium sp. A7-Y TaxID=1349605 RepID=UPI00223CC1E4|nr:hypothetical protein [Aquabacterium sp. A7-Y]MCW7536425.1 hypothetical protein [Aquabacterium sp. A7-Y]